MAWTFGLPAWAGDAVVKHEELKGPLQKAGFLHFRPANTYGDLIRDLLQGRSHAAFATPVVCATVEGAGGRVVVRARRQGSGAYRSVLFARADRQLNLELLQGLVAAWPDAQSMSGYVLPRTLMTARGADPARTLHREVFLGSFRACVEAVLERRADVSATDASAYNSRVHVAGFQQLAGARAAELVALAYSPDCPHGGVILSPALKAAAADKAAEAFRGMMEDPAVLQGVASALDVEGFEVPPPGSYATLREFLEAPARKLHLRLV